MTPITVRRILILSLLLGGIGWSSFSQAADYSFTYDGHTYQIVKSAKTWTAAATDAASRSLNGVQGSLVRIDSQAENDTINTQLHQQITTSEYQYTKANDGGGGAYVWIGATDKVTEGTWLWDGRNSGTGVQFWQGKGKNSGGSAVGNLYNNWGSSGVEPDDYNGSQDCAGLCLNSWPYGSTGQWNDVNISDPLYYVVEYVPEPSTSVFVFIAIAAGIALRLQKSIFSKKS